MDLTQNKLTKAEWESIEKPVNKDEKKIINLITKGFYNTDVKYNDNLSLIEFININDINDAMQYHLYKIYFITDITKLINKYSINYTIQEENKKNNTLKKSESFKIENKDKEFILTNSKIIYEFIILEIITGIYKNFEKKKKKWKYFYYTLLQMKNQSIENINPYIIHFQEYVLKSFNNEISIENIIDNSVEYIEKNSCLLHFSDNSLYSHQKDLFQIFNKPLQPLEEEIDQHKYTSRKNLVLYIAPTATGKTLSPIGLSEKYKIIFVCAARHVGIALSKYAISANKKVAFAFGCQDASDIRLHYSAASSYVIHDRTGREIKYKDGKRKVDNSDGSKVEIIICDILSYEHAMKYMISFNNTNEIIMYWDEPTITLDYQDHPCHDIIKRNWSINVIPNIILSSATLPDETEIDSVIDDFISRFSTIPNIKISKINQKINNIRNEIDEINSYEEIDDDDKDNILYKQEIINKYIKEIEDIENENDKRSPNISLIKSYECKKSISILNKDGYVELPHLMFNDYKKIIASVKHIKQNKTLLRYLDLGEVSKFIITINKKKSTLENIFPHELTINNYFDSLNDINMINIKLNYLDILENINVNMYAWNVIYNEFYNNRKFKIKPNEKNTSETITKTKSLDHPIYKNNLPRTISVDNNTNVIKSNSLVNITTSDAFSLTDGPTIYIAEDVEKIAKFCLQNSKLPSVIMKQITDAILFNNNLNEKISKLEKDIEDAMAPFEEKEKRITKDTLPPEIKNMRNELNKYNNMIKSVTIPEVYIPNKTEHKQKWTNIDDLQHEPYTSSITDYDVEKVMSVNNVKDIWKILLLLGIGLFSKNTSAEYIEIVKEFAIDQKLYIIIADGDYIYGTNYQFCHGYLSKDLIENLTQEKAIQAMGRIGRNKYQMDYTIRFRENEIIKKIFIPDDNKPEARNMCSLLSSDYSLLII